MKKILIIPSWYPLTTKATGGILTMYETEVLQEKYDVKVLFGYSPYLEHRSLYGRYKREAKSRGSLWRTFSRFGTHQSLCLR